MTDETCACPACDSARIRSMTSLPPDNRFRCRDCWAMFAIPVRREVHRPTGGSAFTDALERPGTDAIIPDNPSRGTPAGRSLRDIYGLEP